MSRWLVSSIPAWLLLIGLIVVVAGGAMLIQRYVRRRYPVLNGDEHNPTGVYQEVVPEKKLVFTWEWPGMPERESLVTFRLEPFDGGTELTLIHEQLPDDAARQSHEAGWSGFLDKLRNFLGDPEWPT